MMVLGYIQESITHRVAGANSIGCNFSCTYNAKVCVSIRYSESSFEKYIYNVMIHVNDAKMFVSLWICGSCIYRLGCVGRT